MGSTRIARRRYHRITFVLAGLYNVAWGLFTAAYPQWLFDFAGMSPMEHPQIFASFGMFVGLYGILYLEVAWIPERGWLIGAVGLAGKLLGAFGVVMLIVTDTWPIETAILVLTNDLVWWIPFGMYLYDAWPHYRRDIEQWRAGSA